MSTLEERAIALATRQLALKPAGKGQFVVLKKGGTQTRDRNTQTVTIAGATPHETTAVEEATELQDIPGTLVKAGDARLMVSPVKTDGTPLPGVSTQDLLELRGKDRVIIRSDPYQPMGEVIYTYVWVR